MRRSFGTVVLIAALTWGPGAFAAGDPQVGLALAARWCSGCHADNESASASDAAPSLQHIAQTRTGQTAWLRSWLSAPHPPMPNLSLSREEIDGIIAYLEKLAKTPQ
ncbi:MAG TPA: hypothetical protein VHA35_23870 [Dongiaceae bacterium]|jgi:mono/diheme cytochrome c family protein|nr:hypothetical protein [Dongiaceae bacterium]